MADCLSYAKAGSSVSATTVGDTGKLPAEAFPLSDPRKADIRLGQLLAMTSGIRGNDPGIVRVKEMILDPAGPDGGSRRGHLPAGDGRAPFRSPVAPPGTLGGHCLYVVPSLDLVAVKIGGRDGQYRESDTGLPEPPTVEQLPPDPNWKPRAGAADAYAETLRRIVAALR